MEDDRVSVYVTVKFKARDLIDEESLANFWDDDVPATLKQLVEFFDEEGELFSVIDTERGTYEIVEVERMEEVKP